MFWVIFITIVCSERRNHGMKVIVDLHAVEGSQNGNDHSGTRDGYIEWGDSYIETTVKAMDFLASRF